MKPHEKPLLTCQTIPTYQKIRKNRLYFGEITKIPIMSCVKRSRVNTSKQITLFRSNLSSVFLFFSCKFNKAKEHDLFKRLKFFFNK